jgi:hypothetical protein
MQHSLNRLLLASAALLYIAFLARAKDQPLLTVEVLKAETVHWTTYWPSTARARTDCDLYENSIFCNSQNTTSDTVVYHTQVNLLVKMPDGNNVGMQCHNPPIEATCFQPSLGTYSAKINSHNIHLIIPVTKGKPKYNEDGTLKEPAKVENEEVEFSFR